MTELFTGVILLPLNNGNLRKLQNLSPNVQNVVLSFATIAELIFAAHL